MRLSFMFACGLVWSGAALAGDLRTGFRDAVELNAELRGLVAQRAVIEARQQGAHTLLPSAPSISPSWRTTTFTQRIGFQEFELGGELPLWLPGETQALRGSVEAQNAQLDARIAQLRLLIAAEVRDAYWLWNTASGERDAANARVAGLANQRHRALSEQPGLAEASYRAGNLPFAEVVRVRAQIAQADAQRRRARVEQGRAASQINQTLGLEPQ